MALSFNVSIMPTMKWNCDAFKNDDGKNYAVNKNSNEVKLCC